MLYKFLYIYIVIVRDLEIGIRFKKQEWKKFEEIQFEQLERTWGEQITRHWRKSRNGDIMPPTLPRSCQIISSMLEQPS